MPILIETVYPEIINNRLVLTNQPYDSKTPAKVITSGTKGAKELLQIFNKKNYEN